MGPQPFLRIPTPDSAASDDWLALRIGGVIHRTGNEWVPENKVRRWDRLGQVPKDARGRIFSRPSRDEKYSLWERSGSVLSDS